MQGFRFAAVVLAVGVVAVPAVAQTKPKGKKAEAKVEKVITTKSGLKYVDLVVGKGDSPKPGQSVEVLYVGTFPNGKEFDARRTRDNPFSFPIGRRAVIAGWDEGVATMKVGGKRKLVVPPSLGYGKDDYGPIPGNSTLHFEVELLKIVK